MAHTTRTLSAIMLCATIALPSMANAQSGAPCAGGRNINAYFPANSADPLGVAQLVAMAAYFTGPNGTVAVSGHIDGTERSQGGLDQARAEVVAKGLISDGLRPSQLSVSAAGFAQPAVQTEESEPQNRRVQMCVRAGG